jgi:SAM-dependent methyltransferase
MGSRAQTGDWYDSPAWYDLAFQSETKLEVDFFEEAFRRYCPHPVRRTIEAACGTGRLIVEAAARGFSPVGFDLNRPSLAFLAERLQAKGFSGRAAGFHADMASFTLDDLKLAEPADAAWNTFDGFRHLLTEDAARAHLERMAAAVRPGGIYILGFHLLPPDADEECTERWSETSPDEDLKVTVTLRILSCDRRKRFEQVRISLLVREKGETHRLRDEFPLRIYTAAQVKSLFRSVPQWELLEVFDFWYDFDAPQKLNNDLADAVFVLRRKEG